MLKKSLIIVLFLSLVFGQKRDPRSVALAGATTTIADGIYAVGYNPALIAFQIDKPFMTVSYTHLTLPTNREV